MLKQLSVKNLAIIENIDISFDDGFTVLTGETGAGKSLIIDSLSLLLGARGYGELIRQGEEKAIIRGVFTKNSNRLMGLLAKLDLPTDKEEVVVERIISTGKNLVKINGVAVTLATLNKIAPLLSDIHSQFDFAKILNPDNYLDIVDGYGGEKIALAKESYLSRLEEFKSADAAYRALLEKKRKIDEDRDFYAYQYKELVEADLKEGEEAEIESEISLLKNYDNVYTLLSNAKEIIDKDDISSLYDLSKVIAKLGAIQPKYNELASTLEERYFELEDLLRSFKKESSAIDYDPARLDELLQRSSDIAALKRKYRRDVDGLIEYRDELASLVGDKSNLDTELTELEEKRSEAKRLAFQKGTDLSLLRQSSAKRIETELTNGLKDLLLNADFEIAFLGKGDGEERLKENGIDEIDFLIETNIGEGKKSLYKVVSGGEASRLMLAFKELCLRANKTPTIIFDEIDTGLSGNAANAVAEKIRAISSYAQVISITHLPQVASKADHAIKVEKKVVDGRTFTSIKQLSLEERINEVAYLISGGKVTPKQLEYAKEMVLGK